MGFAIMAFENLNLAGALWQRRGITHIFRPATSGQTAEQAQNLRESQMPGAAQRLNAAPQRQPGGYSSRQGPRSWQPKPAPNNAINNIANKSGQSQMWQPIPLEKWPKLWQEQFRQTKSGRIAWTYWNLGSDLLAARHGDANPEAARQRKARSQLMRRILGDLRHRAGIHTFWPMRLGHDQDAPPEPDLFWSGLKLLGCRGLIIMGSNAANSVLGAGGIRPHMQFREKGILAWPLHNIDAFPEEHYASTLIFLRQSLAVLLPNL